jgi:hypothetical protein
VSELDTAISNAAEMTANDFKDLEYLARRRAGLFTRALDLDDKEAESEKGAN